MNMKKYSAGSILLIALLIIMLLAALAAVIASSITAKTKIKINYSQKAKIRYLAESANAIARNKLLIAQETGGWKNVKDKILEDEIINITITQLDNHLWQIESTAEDTNHIIKYKISNIIIPLFEYSIFTQNFLIETKINNFFLIGNLCTFNMKNNSDINIPILCLKNAKVPELNISYFSSLIPFPNKNVEIITNENTILDGNLIEIKPKLYIATKNLTLKNIKSKASFLSLAGSINVSENCSISRYNNYPALASLRDSINFKNNNSPTLIDGLIYGVNIYISGSLNIKGALYSKNNITIEKNKDADKIFINITFDESILQTKGLKIKWDSFKNISWKEIE